jgi:hypothetical protein
MVGLSNADNTSDANKPISSATQTALNLKANLSDVTTSLALKANIDSPTFTGIVSGITKSMVGLGNVDNTTDLLKPISTATQSALNLKYDASNPSGYTSNAGTVTSVSALTLGTTGTDLSSTVATGTTTPVITLNVPTASATNRGVLSSADWTTFNNKQVALTNPITGTGTVNDIAKFTATGVIGDSNIIDTGTLITLASNTNIASGGLGIGTTTLTGYALRVSKQITGGVTAYGVNTDGTIQSDVTASAFYYRSNANTQATTFTLSNLYHYTATQSTIGAGSTVTSQTGFFVSSSLVGGTNNYGFYGSIPAQANAWNLYMPGTADNYLAGSLGIGQTSLTGYVIRVNKAITGATTAYGMQIGSVINSDVTTTAHGFRTIINTQAAAFTLGLLQHYTASQGVIGAGSTLTNQTGFRVEATLVGATSNFGFRGSIPAQAGAWNIYMDGTALNYMAGNLLLGGTADVASSLFTMSSTTKGFLPPRMTTTQKNAISSPATGLVVFDTTLNKLCVYTTAWQTVTSV